MEKNNIILFTNVLWDADVHFEEHYFNSMLDWLIESLKKQGCEFTAPSGTVTRVASQSFGELVEKDENSEIEIRASWSPSNEDNLINHVNAWLELLAISAGLEPIPQGVTSIAGKN